MLATSQPPFSLQNLFYLEDFADCSDCQKNNAVPDEKARRCLHRHDKFTSYVTRKMEQMNLSFCSDFSTENEGRVVINAMGLASTTAIEEEAKLHEVSVPELLRNYTDMESLLADLHQCVRAHYQRKPGRQTPPKKEIPTVQEEVKTEESQTIAAPPEISLWDKVAPFVCKRVNEDNFKIWLSEVRYLGENEKILLGCPNSFFQEYLGEHYSEVIQEELQKLGELRTVSFHVMERKEEPPKTKESVVQEILPKETFASPLLEKIAKRKADREALKEQCYAKVHGKYVLMVFDYNDKLKLLQQQEAEEDRLEALRNLSAQQEAWRDQRAKASYWWSDGKSTRKRIRKLSDQIERDDLKGTNKPLRE